MAAATPGFRFFILVHRTGVLLAQVHYGDHVFLKSQLCYVRREGKCTEKYPIVNMVPPAANVHQSSEQQIPSKG